jgi:hypothetical protein
MTKYIIAGGALALLLGGTWLSRALQKDSGALAENGLHSHPTLEIFVRGEPVAIPPNIGLGAIHKPVHTHEDVPIIHLEFSGRVVEDDARLGVFFENWGKDMRSFGSNLTMTVNGEVNTEYENYVMRDGDRIQLHYQ